MVLARIGTVKIALGRGAVIGGGNDSFPNQSLEVKDIHISDHSTFGHETTALECRVRLKWEKDGKKGPHKGRPCLPLQWSTRPVKQK
jgi:hypothetical protein